MATALSLTVKLMPSQVFGTCVCLVAASDITFESYVFVAAWSGFSCSSEGVVGARDRLASAANSLSRIEY